MEIRKCSKCGDEYELEIGFHKNGKTKDGRQRYRYECRECYNAAHRNRYKIRKAWKKELMIELFKELKCSVCGYDKYFAALDLHHEDPSVKENEISDMKYYSKDKLREEIKKCIILCANCHREFHAKERGEVPER